MSPRSDYECRKCKRQFEIESTDHATELPHTGCPATTVYRLWRAPHMGAMSSGEPPR